MTAFRGPACQFSSTWNAIVDSAVSNSQILFSTIRRGATKSGLSGGTCAFCSTFFTMLRRSSITRTLDSASITTPIGLRFDGGGLRCIEMEISRTGPPSPQMPPCRFCIREMHQCNSRLQTWLSALLVRELWPAHGVRLLFHRASMTKQLSDGKKQDAPGRPCATFEYVGTDGRSAGALCIGECRMSDHSQRDRALSRSLCWGKMIVHIRAEPPRLLTRW